jgi:hypothetical protein
MKNKEKIKHILFKGRYFRGEFKRQTRAFIIVTLAFTIAFTWRQTLFDVVQTAVQFVLNIQNSATLSILTSTTITLLSIFIIYLTSHWLKDGSDNYG